jgi:hypothetical protein
MFAFEVHTAHIHPRTTFLMKTALISDIAAPAGSFPVDFLLGKGC